MKEYMHLFQGLFCFYVQAYPTTYTRAHRKKRRDALFHPFHIFPFILYARPRQCLQWVNFILVGSVHSIPTLPVYYSLLLLLLPLPPLILPSSNPTPTIPPPGFGPIYHRIHSTKTGVQSNEIGQAGR